MGKNTFDVTDPYLKSSFPKVKTSIKKYGNRYRVYFTWKKKQIFLNKGLGGEPLDTLERAELAAAYIQGSGYKEEEWKKSKSFNLSNAYDNWLGLMTVSEDYKYQRKVLKKRYTDFFGANRDIRTITSTDLQKFYLKLQQEGLKGRNIMVELKIFLLSYEDDFEKFPKFPKLRKYQEKAVKHLAIEHQGQVFEFIPEYDLPIFTFMKYTACRPNEAEALQKTDINWAEGYFNIQYALSKHGKLKETKTKCYHRLRMDPLSTDIWTH